MQRGFVDLHLLLTALNFGSVVVYRVLAMTSWFLVFLVPTLSFSGIVAHRMNRYVDPAAPCERERAKPR